MKKILIFLSIVTLLAVVPAAQATYFPATITLDQTNHIEYPTEGLNDDVEIQLDFSVSANTLTVDIFNNSNTNWAPALSGIGFDLDPDSQTLASWSLFAQTSTGSTENISSYWKLDNPGGIGSSFAFDYYPTSATGGNPKDGALYNPDLLLDPAPLGYSLLPAGEDFFTQATLTVVFDSAITEDTEIISAGARLVNVGAKGEGSLKLIGTPVFDPPTTDPPTTDPPVVPEPGTMILLGFGLISLAGIGRRKIKK